jgi:murein L,D-transpeptidase YcbB/YkuD
MGTPTHFKLFATITVALLVALPLAASSSESTEQIRIWFEGFNASGESFIGGNELSFAQDLTRLYEARGHSPIWQEGGELDGQLDELIAAIQNSAAHGFYPERYHLQYLLEAATGNSETDWALDLIASDAFLAQASHRGNGVVSPQSINAEWFVESTELNAAELLRNLLTDSGSVRAALDAVLPQAPEYWTLVQERARIAQQPETETIQIPPGDTLRPGSRGERVRLLQERLLGPGEHDGIYGPQLEKAVIEFQQASAVEADGVVGRNTLAILNATQFDWLERIDANLERWRWLPRETPDTYVRVNIAAFTLRAIRAGHDDLNMDVIVGRPYRQSPVFNNLIRYMVVNPFWNVPTRIAVQDKLPLLKEDPVELVQQGYEFRANGETEYRPVDQMDWNPVTRANFRYQLRQRPGPQNALGQMKFMLPNSYAVYLHDTPARELFSHTERIFSSGCIRLQDPAAFARWLLELNNSPELANLDSWLESEETNTVYFRQPVPVYIVYFTAFTDDSGNVVFRRDVYDRDQAITSALQGTS